MAQLTSDQIGVIGEGRVHQLCILAKLEASKPDPDRTGKDLIVEWPFASLQEGQTYDMRLPPLTCVLQVKSALPGTDHVKLSLAVAERLIRDHRPAFIIIPRLTVDSEDAEVGDIGVIHLRGDALARVLKRLRSLSGKSIVKLNDEEIAFTIAGAKHVQPAASKLRRHFEDLIGPDIAAYAIAKDREVNTIGFSANSYKIRVTFPSSAEDLISRSLGGLPLTASAINLSHTRFGKEAPGFPHLPSSPFQNGGDLVIQPICRRCELVFTSHLTKNILRIDADLITSPFQGLPDELQQYRLRTPLIDLTLRNEGFDVRTRDDQINDLWPLSTWLQTYRLFVMLSAGDAQITVHINGTSARFDLSGFLGFENIEPAHILSRERYFRMLAEIIEAVPGLPHPRGRYEDFVKLSPELLRLAHATVLRKQALKDLSFKSNHELEPSKMNGETFLIFSKLDIASTSIAFAQKAVFSVKGRKRELHWRSIGQLKLLAAEALSGPDMQSYEEFKDKISCISSVYMHFDPGLFNATPGIRRAA